MNEDHKHSEDSLVETAGNAMEAASMANMGQNRDAKLIEIQQTIHEKWTKADQLYLDIGNSLLAAKCLLGKHGEWLNWLTTNFPSSIRQAQRLMRVSEWFGTAGAKTPLASYLDFTKAYILTRIPKAKLDDFLKQCNPTGADTDPIQAIQGMSKCELEKAVREYLMASVQSASKVKTIEVNTSAESPEDRALNMLTQVESTISKLVEDVSGERLEDEIRDTLFSELRRLCEETLAQLPSEAVECE